MLQLILKTHLAFLLIPLITLAIEPNNPVTFCERFLADADKVACVKKTEQNHDDWYASAACSLQEDDKNFLVCLDEIHGGTFSPEALELCAKSRNLSDISRLNCIQKIKNRNYSRAEIKKCSESASPESIAKCLSSASSARKPAATAPAAGFQSLEIHH